MMAKQPAPKPKPQPKRAGMDSQHKKVMGKAMRGNRSTKRGY